ncbi:MAG: matrixin family metalloprotease, partial [Bacteroidota bacterium]
MKTKTLSLLFINLLLSLFSIAQQPTQAQKNESIKTDFNEAEIVFEGYFLKKNPSILMPDKFIYTMHDFKVTTMIKGTIPQDSIIQIELEEGSAWDPETGIGVESFNSHGNGFIPSSKAVYFLHTKNERKHYRLKKMIDISNQDKIVYNDISSYDYNKQPYKKLADLYTALSKLSGKKLRVEKKSSSLSLKLKEVSIIEEPIIPYEIRLQNFNTIIAKKTEQYLQSKANQSAKITAQDVTLQIANTATTGTTTKYLEFDVNIKSSNSLSFLDNMPIWITYNTAVFGYSVVANNNITVTNGTSFNNSQYLNANANMVDQSSNTLTFNVGTDFNLTNPNRVNVTTTYKQLAHVKIKITGCGNATAALTNSANAIIAALYTTTSNSSSFQIYDNLLYSGSAAINIVCKPTIIDFNSPINGGLNEVLTIKGYGFGATRGNGQVKFRNADLVGFPYINKLDNFDYIDWNDTVIKLKMPSTIDTIGGIVYSTPCSGNFKIVINNATDSITSSQNLASQTFSVNYSIFSKRPSLTGISRAQKLKANLYKSNITTGGYVIRLDSSISKYPDRKACVIKAIQKWVCATTINIKLGTDTTMQKYGTSDKICNIFFAEHAAMSTANTVADSRANINICPTLPVTSFISDFDIRIDKSRNFIYDTSGTKDILANKIDFYEVILHEIGHGIGLMHVVDSSAVMFYRTLGNLSVNIPAASRRNLKSFTSDVDGANVQLATSLTNITGLCAAEDMVQISNCSISMNSPITTSSFINTTICNGNTISVPFTSTSNFNLGNIFTAQLSNAAGSFASPTTIGTLNSPIVGSISAVIPINTAAGSGYRIRVVSTNPIITGSDNGLNITVKKLVGDFNYDG